MRYRIEYEPKELNATIKKGPYTVAVVWSGDSAPTMERVKANAQLLSTAPELLEALKKSNDELSELANIYWNETESFDEGSDERGMYLVRLSDVRKRMNQNKEAIAKAEGKE